MLVAITSGLIIIIFITIIYIIVSRGAYFSSEFGKKRAGEIGEDIAFDYINQVLTLEDYIFRNVVIEYDGKKCECDYIIVNKYGIFIIEIKNCNGKLSGKLDDYNWTKTKITDAGNEYVSTVYNPIKQVNRQVYILAKFLKDSDFNIWIKGYFIILNDYSVISEQALYSKEDIARAIHTRAKENKKYISKHTQEEIVCLLRSII